MATVRRGSALLHISGMPIIPLYGHDELREKLARAAAAGTLPASLLFHGPRGVGKQRLALWLAQLLLCDRDNKPCGTCRSCRYSLDLTHPDLHWYFARPRPKDADPDLQDVRDDYSEIIAERAKNAGLYSTPPGNEGIFVATVRALLLEAAITPAISSGKVFIIGDAERMVSQEGADQAANAFLKLLEEPNANTHIILTSSEPGALLPTIRSRAVAVRVPRLTETSMRAFLADSRVAAALDSTRSTQTVNERIQLADGAPGTLFGDNARGRAMSAARKLLDAASAPHASARYAAAMSAGASGARGAFTDMLDSLIVLLAERTRAALHDGNERRAAAITRAAASVGNARVLAGGNVNPQLLTADILRDLSTALR
jgi:DNA polymerase III subunit delta'